ncbi:MAG: hypothetical protein AAFP04_08190 [Myxococcota bacterium]
MSQRSHGVSVAMRQMWVSQAAAALTQHSEAAPVFTVLTSTLDALGVSELLNADFWQRWGSTSFQRPALPELVLAGLRASASPSNPPR